MLDICAFPSANSIQIGMKSAMIDARNVKKPCLSRDGALPGIVAQIACTFSVVPVISVVPVSMAAMACPLPVDGTNTPFIVRAVNADQL